MVLLDASNTAQQNPLHVGKELFCPSSAFLVGEAGQRVRGDCVFILGYAHHPRHCLGRVVENVRDDGCCGNAQALHLDSVVHTARTAGPSISHPGDEHIHPVEHVFNGL